MRFLWEHLRSKGTSIFPPAALDRCVVVEGEDVEEWADLFVKFSTKQRLHPVVWEVNVEVPMAGILGQFELRGENWGRER
jgi:hypothetical protein